MDQTLIDSTIDRIRQALEAGRLDEAVATLRRLHPADWADAFADLPDEDQSEILPHLDPAAAADLLSELEEDEAAETAEKMAPDTLADVLDRMDPDEAADILGDLPADHRASTLAHMEDAAEVIPLLAHPDETAGGLMTTSFVALRRYTTTQQAIEFLRTVEPGAEMHYYLYVVDREQRLIGVAGLRDLVVARPETTMEAIMKRDVISVPVGTDQEEVARIMTRYNLAAVPVVNGDHHLVGVITYDDVAEVLEQEATEDIYRLANVSDSELEVWSPVPYAVRRRLPWLYFNLLTAFLAAWVISRFEATIAKVAVLAVFQSIVAGQGGNAGTQTLALMVRGIALGEVEFKDAWRAILREAMIGVIHGVAVGAAVAVGAYLWRGIPMLGVIIGLAMIGNMIAAGIAGTIVPLGLKALRLDPALASAVIVTTVTDSVGFGLFLGLATLFVRYLVPAG